MTAALSPICSWCDDGAKWKRSKRASACFKRSFSSDVFCKDQAQMIGLSSCFASTNEYLSSSPSTRKSNNVLERNTAVSTANPSQYRSEDKTNLKTEETKQRRVVVTGMGVICSLGDDPTSFYRNLLEGKSGISAIKGFSCTDFPTRIASEIKSFSPDGWVEPKFSKRQDLSRCIKKVLLEAGVDREYVNYINTYACTTTNGDIVEYRGLISHFGQNIEVWNTSKEICTTEVFINPY